MKPPPTVTSPFRRSSYSGPDHSECVEVAITADGGRAVRDSKDPARGTAYFGPHAWQALLSHIRTARAPREGAPPRS
ncbi:MULTISPECIES: DUF397 domain-containing protein [Streptomyces]|uniref:DUF397 domain-containing protein n=1 Tax=Streptomyces TaxID=1883 RepID=UPI0009985949|nr:MULTISPECIES: DUF397 domain-containing protein [Streptomyces]